MWADDWADFVTLSRAQALWSRTASKARDYGATVDDYTNDLTGRDYIERALEDLPEPWRSELRAAIAPADQAFREATEYDKRSLLASYFRIDDGSGWWWRRIPKTGPLATYLNTS